MQFLVNTGSEVCVTSPSHFDHKHTYNKPTLAVVNSTPIPTFRKHSLTLNIGLCSVIQCVFINGDVHKPIIGVYFPWYFGHLVNVKWRQLVDMTTHIHFEGIHAPDPSPRPSITPKYHYTYIIHQHSPNSKHKNRGTPTTPVSCVWTPSGPWNCHQSSEVSFWWEQPFSITTLTSVTSLLFRIKSKQFATSHSQPHRGNCNSLLDLWTFTINLLPLCPANAPIQYLHDHQKFVVVNRSFTCLQQTHVFLIMYIVAQ